MFKKITCLCTLSFILVNTVIAQDINLFVKKIKEERNSDQQDSSIEIEASISGLKIDDFNQIKLGKITKAIDDKGNSLKKLENSFGDDYSSQNEITIKLEAPFRSATKIETVEGTVKYFSPSKENGSKISIQKPLDKFNTNLLAKYSKKVKLTPVSKEHMQSLKDEDEKEYKKQLEKLKQEGVLEGVVAESVDLFKSLFDGFSSMSSDKEAFSFVVQDEEENIVAIIIKNEKGEKMNYGSSSYGNRFKTISLREVPTNDWTIEILLENEKSLKELKFSIPVIILP